ncbi:hypothetical protein DM02DRAFT_673841 [Periconia macrospinosa]|uniref:DNA mismatch repair protein MSH3 n=1 Tax=Periconia macrospinosa TaxID=97972 RepID=A0A2V1DI63_9PLEO|nr:hypothetical protein DM02DRAFT_673841 [Periconia macrospinosa]
MLRPNRPPTSYSAAADSSYPTYSYSYGDYNTTSGSRPGTRRGTGRPSTARPRTGASTIARVERQEVVCAIAESRGISPTVGLSFINIDTGEAVLCQICDSQTYVKTLHKLQVYGPTVILCMSTAASPKSKLFSIIEESLIELGSKLTLLDRRYWSESSGMDYIHDLAFADDVEAIKLSVTGAYYAVCCIAAILKYLDLGCGTTFAARSLRIKFESGQGAMLIDVSTIRSLELVQNLQNPKSRDCLFGLLNETQTLMGARMLRSNVLQPLTDKETIIRRYDAVDELQAKEQMFYATRGALKNFIDADKVLTALIIIPKRPSIYTTEQSINHIIMLKAFVLSVSTVYEALSGARCPILATIREICAPENALPIQRMIEETINEDVTYAKQPLELRNQRTWAVKTGVHGLLDVARQTYKENMADAYQYINELSEEHNMKVDLKYEPARGFYIRISTSEIESRDERHLPVVFTNIVRKKKYIECQTLVLMKRNLKVSIVTSGHTSHLDCVQVMNAYHEVVLCSDAFIQEFIEKVRCHMSALFKMSEAIAMLDMISAFAHLVTVYDYVKPRLTDTLGLKDARHPIREKIMQTKFIPNDVYATQQCRFQIVTGCNMSGKSTFIRSVALLTIMAQIGSFVPARSASFPVMNQLFARVGMDDSIECNVSTFAAEMREMAFILRNIDNHSMAIIDELGRGTSTRDGLAIAIAIAEAMVDSKALVWFATHFRDIATILSERNGVVAMHLAVEVSENDTITMLYKAVGGMVQQAHYGLALASVVPLPPSVLADATLFAHILERRLVQKKKMSANVLNERRRRLILDLKEHLLQAYNGSLEGELLASWLMELQKEFVNRMTSINASVNEDDVEGHIEERDDQPEDEGADMMDEVSEEEEHEDQSRSMVSVTSETLSSARAISENGR